MLPSTFGIIFDGCSLDSEHYTAIFATWSTEASHVEKRLLSCYVQDDIDDEADYVEGINEEAQVFGLTSADQYDCIFSTLMQYNFNETQLQDMENIVEIFSGDNCSTNLKMARDAGIPIVGCKSHLLNLDVQDFIGKEQKVGRKRKNDTEIENLRSLINKIDHLMGKLKNIKNAAILRTAGITTIPQRKNETRWSSIFNMLKSFIAMYPRLVAINFGRDKADIRNLLPSATEYEKLETLFETLQKFESVSKALQNDDLKLYQAHGLLERHQTDIPEALTHIDPTYARKKDYDRNYHL